MQLGNCCRKKKKKPTPPPHPYFPVKCPVSESDPQLEDNLTRAPPPPTPPIEEETVKEVLSKTSKPSIQKIEEEDEKIEKKALIVINGCDEISDLCNLSESVSTTMMAEKKGKDGDDGEVEMRRVENRSPAKFQRRGRNAAVFWLMNTLFPNTDFGNDGFL